MRVDRRQELLWRRTLDLALQIYRVTGRWEEPECADFVPYLRHLARDLLRLVAFISSGSELVNDRHVRAGLACIAELSYAFVLAQEMEWLSQSAESRLAIEVALIRAALTD